MAEKLSKYISGVGWRYDSEHRMNRRNSNLDYHLDGMAYMITLKVEEGAKLLGVLPTAAQLCNEAHQAKSAPSALATHPQGAYCAPSPQYHVAQCQAAQCHATRRMIEEGDIAPGAGMAPSTGGAADAGTMQTGYAADAGAMQSAGMAGGVMDFDRIPPEAVFTRLSALGEALRKAWLTLPERFPNITIRDRQDEFCIMPEHFHGILFYTGNGEHLGEIEKCLKHRVMAAYRKLLVQGETKPVGTARQWMSTYLSLPKDQQAATRAWIDRSIAQLYSPTVSDEKDPPVFRVSASGKHNKTGFLFSPGYNDKPFSDEDTLNEKRHYILHNPIERVRRSSNHEWLHAKRGGVDTALTISATICYLRRECHPKDVAPDILNMITGYLLTTKNASQGRVEITCDTYGNRELLDRNNYRLLPLVCHRKDRHLYEQQRMACLTAATEGAVIVSACISPQENALFKELTSSGYRTIRIEDNGFPDIYHPSEDRQHLCATGSHLIITPWRYHYVAKDQSIRTAYCKTMNCIAQAVCRRKDDWWKRE